MHKFIEATYQLYTENNGELQLVEETSEGQPLRFYTGLGMAMECFEKGIEPFNEGDDYEFSVSKDNAYGEYHDEMVIDIPRKDLSPNGELDETQVYVGATLPLQNQNGQRFLSRVIGIDDKNVRVDLNHPLAGKDLTFRGHVIESREASPDEIEDWKKKLRRHHCGTGCGGCGGGHCGGHHKHCGNCAENN